jgi:hypothetical protein
MIINNLKKLSAVVSNDAELQIIRDFLDLCVRYFKVLFDFNVFLSFKKLVLTSLDEYQNKYTKLDMARRRTHNALISSISIVNRLCEVHGIEKISKTSPITRREASIICKKIVNECFDISIQDMGDNK